MTPEGADPQGLTPAVDSYSYHRLFGEIRPGETDPGRRWNQWDLLDEIQQLPTSSVSLETCFFPDEDGFWIDLREQLDKRVLDAAIAWGAPRGLKRGTDPAAVEDLTRTIDRTAELGANMLRIVVGSPADLLAEPESAAVERLDPMLTKLLDQADSAGVSMSLETHCALTVRAFTELIERLEGRLGVVLDTANVVRVGADLIEATRALAPHVRMLHVKDVDLASADVGSAGGWWPSAALGTGDLDLDGALEILDREGFDGWACVEVADVPPSTDEIQLVRDSVAWLADRTTGVMST